MLSAKMADALSKQLNAELYSSCLYLSMSAHFESVNLRGFARWVRVQAEEERTHAAKFFDYIVERGARVLMTAIAAPPAQWDSPLAVFKAVYEHEQKVTGLINDLVNLAEKEKDHATRAFLQWFVTEQVEEEASANEVVQKLTLIGESAGGLFVFDHHLGQRKAGG
jgi:ferritin